MTDQPRPVNVVNIATGLCFVALGVLLLLQRAGTIDLAQIISLWPLALVFLGGAVVWQASRGGDASAGFGACAGWLVWVAILGLVFSYVFDRRAAAEATVVDGRVNVFAVLAGDNPSATGRFTGATVTTLLGGAKMDLTGAGLAPGETAVVDVLTILGGVEILVPADWQVEFNTTSVAAGVEDERGAARREQEASPATSEAGNSLNETPSSVDGTERPRLIVTGLVLLGGVNIK